MLNIDKGWANQNSGTNYPFADAAGMASVSGVVFPRGVIVDATIGAPRVDAPVRIGSVLVGADRVVLVFMQGSEVLGSTELTSQSAGWVIIQPATPSVFAGRIEVNTDLIGALFAMGTGPATFDDLVFVPYSVFMSPRTGLAGIVAGGKTLTGDITLIAGDGIEAKVLGDGRVQLSATGLPFQGRSDTELVPRGIRRIIVVAENLDGSTTTASVLPTKGAISVDVATTTPTATPAALTITATDSVINIGVSK